MEKHNGADEIWREQYRARPYLRHLSQPELLQRARDVFSNLSATLSGIKNGLLREGEETKWLALWTHVLDESEKRTGLPSIASPLGFCAENETPPESAHITNSALRVMKKLPPPGTYFVKYGQATHLRTALKTGRIQIRPASSYNDSLLTPALRDNELTIGFQIVPSEIKMEVFDGKTGKPKGSLGAPIDNIINKQLKTDYYVYCVSELYNPRLFVDFGYEACLIIHQHKRFFQIMVDMMDAKLPSWVAAFTPVVYVDPFNAKMTDVDIYTSKHFRHAHEREWRVVSAPTREPTNALSYLYVELGPLTELCDLIELT